MTINLPFDGLTKFLDGKKTYGAAAIAILVQFGQPYFPWITPEWLANLAWAAMVLSIVFNRSGGKSDITKALEQFKTILETPIQPEPAVEEKAKK